MAKMTLQEAQAVSKNGVAILRDGASGVRAKTGWAWKAGHEFPYRTTFFSPSHYIRHNARRLPAQWRERTTPYDGDDGLAAITARKKSSNLRKIGGWIPAKPMSPLEQLASAAEDD